MRYLLPPIAIGIIILSSSAGISFAQTAGPSPQQILGVYAQIVVRDSSGTLVSYLETSNVKIVDPAQFNQLINQNIGLFKRSLINDGGQDLEILQVNQTLIHKEVTIISLNLISMDTPTGSQLLVVADHDGFPVAPGDRMTTYWTIVRTAGS